MTPAGPLLVQPIPDEDHIARHCQPSELDDANLLPIAKAFYRKQTEPSVSVNWLEYLNGNDLEDCIQLLRPVLASKRCVRKTHKIAVICVGSAREALRRELQTDIEIRHDRLPGDPSHAGIFGCDVGDDTVALILRDLVEQEDMYDALATP